MFKRIALALWLSTLPCSILAAGCNSEAKVEVATPEDAVVEEHEGGSIAWSVAGDGKVRGSVTGPDGKPIKEKVSGTLAWKADPKAEAKTVPLDLDANAGVLVAAGPKLDADITEVGYTVTVDGKPWSGTLHLPVGGTAELVASAKAGAEASASLDGKVGPHGGVIQIVGEDRFEIVADEVSGEVRVYLLDADLNIVAMGDRKITLAVVADAPQIIVLEPDVDGGLFLRGKWNIQADPIKITLAVRAKADAKVNVAIVGFKPGVKFALHAKGPRLKVRVKSAFDGDIDAKARAKLGLKAKVKVAAPDVNVKAKANIKAPDVDVKAKVKAPEVNVKKKADAKASAGAGAGAKAGAKAGAGASVGVKIN